MMPEGLKSRGEYVDNARRMTNSAGRRARGPARVAALALAVACLATTPLIADRALALAASEAAVPGHVISTVAGGLARGPAMAFTQMSTEVAVSGTTLYVTDGFFDVIRAIDLISGDERVVAGVGSALGFYGDGGQATSAGLSGPGGIAADSQGNLFIIDRHNRRMRKVTPAGVISTVVGGGPERSPGHTGPVAAASLTPLEVTVDNHDNVYFTADQMVWRMDPTGGISAVAGGGSAHALIDGQPALGAQVGWPVGLTVDTAGNLYMAEDDLIWRITPEGIARAVRQWLPGTSTFRDWTRPGDLQERPDGTLLVLEPTQVLAVDGDGNTRVVVGNGTHGSGGDGGAATDAQLSNPTGLDVDSSGNLFIANGVLRRVSSAGTITSVTARGYPTAPWEGKPAVETEILTPTSVATGPQGAFYLYESELGRIRKVDAAGLMTTVAGGASAIAVAADGVPAASAVIVESTLTVSPNGTLYLASGGQVFRVDADGILRLVAGAPRVPCYYGADCSKGDGGPATAAQIGPSGLAVAADGTLYIAEADTNRIRRVDLSGIITTIAGGPRYGFSGDGGPAKQAQLRSPAGIQVDRWGNVYFADRMNSRVRKIDVAGVITTVAGTESGVSAGDGGLATAAGLSPTGIALDPSGRLFVTDEKRVRMVDTDGRISTVAGKGSFGLWGDGGMAVEAGLTNPAALTIDSHGDLLIADGGNRRIRKVTGLADLRPPGTLRAWGWTAYGQVGGPATQAASPLMSGGPDGFAEVAAGGIHSIGLRAEGTVWSWGSNVLGQLGDGSTVDRRSPARVGATTLTGVTQVSAGHFHSLAVKSDGSVWGWGWNGSGQLGDGTTVDRHTPTLVAGLSDVVAVSAGVYHSLAVTSDGAVWAWGWNGFGMLGDSTTTERHLPTRVLGLSGIVTVTAGALHSAALGSDGVVSGWGWNGFGQLGDGTTTERHAPVRVPGLTGVVALGGGSFHGLARKADGSAWAWGLNGYGQLGIGAQGDRLAPVRIPGLSGVRDLSGGMFHSVARLSDGSVWTWGLNHVGQLGDGTLTDRQTPVAVRALVASPISAGAYHTLAA